MIWIFPAGESPKLERLLSGDLSAAAARYVDVGGESDQSIYPPGKLEYRIVPVLYPGFEDYEMGTDPVSLMFRPTDGFLTSVGQAIGRRPEVRFRYRYATNGLALPVPHHVGQGLGAPFAIEDLRTHRRSYPSFP